MNTIIFSPADFIAPQILHLRGRRAEHLLSVLKVRDGQILSVGELNGQLGTAEVVATQASSVDLRLLDLDTPPPPNLPVTLILGLPRPRMLQRSLQTIATMGVQTLCLIHSARVEKSFWQTPLLQEQAIHEQLVLGLEQGCATQMPEINLCRSWKEFIQIWLPHQRETHPQKIVAHPGNYAAAVAAPSAKTLLAIGPEGGFVDAEVATLSEFGFQKVSLGPRILRVETAIPVLLAKLF